MSIFDRILERTGIVTQRQVSEMVQATYKEGYQDGYMDGGEDEPASGDLSRYGYRRTAHGLRDFSNIDRDRILEIVWILWQSNPVAERATEIKRDYILGRGISFSARDDRLQKVLDDFWAVNNMAKRIKEYCLQLFLFGSQLITVFVRKSDGRVKLGYIDPAEIEEVIPHPENSQEMWAVVVKRQPASKSWQRTLDQRVYRIIRPEEAMADNYSGWLKEWRRADEKERLAEAEEKGEPVQPLERYSPDQAGGEDRQDLEGKLVTAGQAQLEDWEREMLEYYGLEEYTGSCFYWKVNSVSNQPFGYSDLLRVADWLDQQDETLFALGKREQWANYFSWDVTLRGADEAKVKERSRKIREKGPPRSGSVNVHNESEEWEMNYPQLNQTGSVATADAIQTHAFGGLGFPRAWFGYGDETNRATLQAQGDPTWRTLEHDQDMVRDIIMELLEFSRDQAEIAGHWSPEELLETLRRQMQDLDGAAQSQNGRLAGQFEAGVPDLGTKLAGKIVQDEVPDDGANGQADDDTIDIGDVKETNPREITVTMPEMTAKDLSMVANMLSAVASAMVVAEDQGWQDKAKSVEAWAKALAEFGVELDVAAVQKALEEKQQELESRPDLDRFNTAVTRHGVMLAGDGDDETAPDNWGGMDSPSREMVLETLLEALGVQHTSEDVQEIVRVLEGAGV